MNIQADNPVYIDSVIYAKDISIILCSKKGGKFVCNSKSLYFQINIIQLEAPWQTSVSNFLS